jgi:uncharacterized membrane protein YedE/YeeE
MRIVLGFASGLVFGLGLVVSGMADPAKVLNFLDLAGTWDPSLAFVMGGAVLVTFIGYRLVLARKAPLLMGNFDVPASKQIDLPLVGGAAIFGIGWGIGGFCPGPALTALPLLAPGTLVFVPAMLIGLWAGQRARDAVAHSRVQKGA